jgi:hypothetical protein
MLKLLATASTAETAQLFRLLHVRGIASVKKFKKVGPRIGRECKGKRFHKANQSIGCTEPGVSRRYRGLRGRRQERAVPGAEIHWDLRSANRDRKPHHLI